MTETRFKIDCGIPAAQVPLHSHRDSLKIHCGYKYLGPNGPGQPRLDSGSPQQVGFPLPDAVARLLGCHPSAPRSPSSKSLEQHWVKLTVNRNTAISVMEHELCHVHTEHCFSGQTGHHEHRRQEMTDAITRTTKYLMVTTTYKHTVDATETVECRCLAGCVILHCSTIFLVALFWQSLGRVLVSPLFHCFHARRLQIMARMIEGNLPQSSAIFVNKLPWRLLISHLMKIQSYSKIICVLSIVAPWRTCRCECSGIALSITWFRAAVPQFIALFAADQAKTRASQPCPPRWSLPRGRDELVHRTTDAVQSSPLVTWFLQFTENT